MKNKLTQFMALLLLFFSSHVFANPITTINFIGLNNNSESALLEILPFKIGSNFSNDLSDKIIESLFKTGLFENISIVKSENSLNITLKENPNIKFFDINLNSDSGIFSWIKGEKLYFTSEVLNGFIKDNKLSAGNVYTKRKLDDFILLLKSKYVESGYFNIEIKEIIKVDIQNRVGVNLEITQGSMAKIESLKISGSTNFKEKELLKLFEIGEADFAIINYFTNKDNFSDSKFKEGLDLLTQKYFNSGYLDFNILNVTTDLNNEKDKIFIEVIVSEGTQYKLGNISFSGELGNKSPGDLASATAIKSGDIFNRDLIMTDIQKITDIYADQGYAFIDIQPNTSDFLDKVNVDISISLNKKVYVNRIIISGNTRTQDSVIRREIGISEGGLYSRSTLRKSIKKLRRLGYFSDVQMAATEVLGLPDRIDLNFLVVETKTGAISLSLSHSNSYGISLGAGIQEKNIFGSGNTLNSELKLSDSYNKISLYFENPNFNEKNHSINFGAYVSEIDDDDVMKDSYEINTKGMSIGYGVPLTEDTRINTNIEYSKNTIKCGATFSSSSYELNQCGTKNNDELKLNVNWSENTLDSYLYPTEGKSNSISLDIATPVGNYRYISANASHSSYQPINSNLTLKFSGDISIAKGYSGKKLPFFKRFFGGGSGSVRGFGNKTLGPLYSNGKAKGGELSVFGSANIITPAAFFDNNENMRLSAFIDTGNIFEKSSSIKLDQLRMSTGIGFAYLSPIGSIGAYYSTPLLKKSGDIIENFGISLGTGF